MNTTPPRLLFWCTLTLLILAGTFVYYTSETKLPPSVKIKTNGHPTLGYANAKVKIVIFEEPKCSNCRIFNREIFPKIKEKYIDTNKAQYTVIPVVFLPGSMPAAVALLCVYHSDPIYPNSELFFKYFDYMYEHEPGEHVDWAKTETLIEYADKTSPAINLDQLKKCIDMDTYRSKIQKNTNYAKQVMKGMLGTPSLFVNGIEVEDLSFEGVEKVIKEVMQHEGVY